MKKKFPKEDLQELVYDYSMDGYDIISNKIIDHSRWSLIYELIFKHEDKYYRSSYRRAATECQDESPYEYESDMVECSEVKPVEVTEIKYIEVESE